MIIAATVGSLSDNIWFDWFDVALVVVLGFGLFRGRRNGMSKELLPVMQWVTVVVLCGFAYPFLGRLIASTSGLDKMWSCLAAYLGLLIVVLVIFSSLKRQYAERLAMSDCFKSGEYYLGMLSGMIRFACIVLVALALLNAPVYTKADVARYNAFIKQTLGGGIFSGNYFPTLQQIQEQVFQKSFAGQFIKNGSLGILLIDAAPPAVSKPKPKITIGHS